MKLVTTFPLKVTVYGHFFSRGENVWSLNYPHSAIFSSFIRHFFFLELPILKTWLWATIPSRLYCENISVDSLFFNEYIGLVGKKTNQNGKKKIDLAPPEECVQAIANGILLLMDCYLYLWWDEHWARFCNLLHRSINRDLRPFRNLVDN